MTTNVLVSTEVVNTVAPDGAIAEYNCTREGYTARVSSLLERIEWICEKRGEPGKPLSYRQLSLRAGLPPTHVGTIVTRLKSNPGSDIERATLVKIAKGGEVSADWLASGDGDPEGTTEHVVERDERYPARAEAARFARANGVPEWAIQDVMQDRNFETEMTAEDWYGEMKSRARRKK